MEEAVEALNASTGPTENSLAMDAAPFREGTLWERIAEVSERAFRIGALLPIPTDQVFIEDAGIRFSVRVLAGLVRKQKEQKRQEDSCGVVSPFLPYDRELFVANVSQTHVALLNKYNVVDRHLLIVTRHFEEQEMLLTPADFLALRRCMDEYESLGFYNSGRQAGASQEHKHLQMVPLPLVPGIWSIPVEPLLTASVCRSDGIGTVPGFPFLHAFARFEAAGSLEGTAVRDYVTYRAMLATVGMQPPDIEGYTRQTGPYCFLITNGWMLLVPRTREHFEDISLNSLAFVGSLFVTRETQVERLRSYGPLRALASVAVPK